MRYLLSAVAAATLLSAGIAPAAATKCGSRRSAAGPQRAESHISLHLSRHALLSGSGMALRGRVSPGGRRGVKVVFRGPAGGVVETRAEADGSFALRWSPRLAGNYTARAYGIHGAPQPRRRQRRPAHHRLPPRRRLLLRARPLRQRPRLRRGPDAGDARRRPQVAALRDQVTLRYRGRSRHRAGDRPRALCRRPRLRPHRGDQGAARASPRRRRLGEPLRRRRARCLTAEGCGSWPRRGLQPVRPSCSCGAGSAPRGGVRVVLESGDADAEQAHRPRRGVGAQQLQSELVRPAPGRRSACSRVCERVTLVQSSSRTLIPIVRPRGRARAGAGRAPPRARQQVSSSSPRSATSTSKVISVDCDLVSRATRDRGLVLEPGAAPQPGAGARTEGGSSSACSRRPQLGQGADSHPLQLRPRSSDRCPARARASRRRSAPAPPPARAPPARPACPARWRSWPAAGSPRSRPSSRGRSRADLGRHPPHRRLRREEPGEVEVGLVEPDHLDRLDVAPQDLHHLRRSLPVGGEVGAEVDRVRQPPPRHRRRHRRVDAGQLARLVARRRHHRPRPRAADDHRLAPQLRPPLQLDRRVEGVHVEMGDRPPGGHPPR